MSDFDSTAASSNDFATATGAPAVAKADLTKRVLGVVIDSVLATAIQFSLFFIPILPGLLAAAYMVTRDGLNVGPLQSRSLGKHLMGLRVERADGQPVDLETSVRRNWMFGFGAVVAVAGIIPFLDLLLAPLVGLVGLAIGLYELYNVVNDDEGIRWGDKMASTKVVEV
jgi:uncharacterized RDD family membrane protein YckC